MKTYTAHIARGPFAMCVAEDATFESDNIDSLYAYLRMRRQERIDNNIAIVVRVEYEGRKPTLFKIDYSKGHNNPSWCPFDDELQSRALTVSCDAQTADMLLDAMEVTNHI